MANEIRDADLIIIGAGIAGLSLALRAAQNELSPLILDDGCNGATSSATGMIAPRPDYMPKDISEVKFSDLACFHWMTLFPDIITPRQFLLPIDPDCRCKFSYMESLLRKYDGITPLRRKNLPASSRISRAVLKNMEPNLRNDYFEGALSFWELTVDPQQLLCEFKLLLDDFAYCRRIMIEPESVKFETIGNKVKAVRCKSKDGKDINLSSSRRPIVVVNAAGPWIQDVVTPLGISLDIKLYLGVQMSVPGNFFQNGIITFDQDGKYCVCLPRENFLQVGPTNTLFTGHPDSIKVPSEDLGRLLAILKSILNPDIQINKYDLLKAGLRVKPNFGDTNRPIIWSHRKNGFFNLYTLFPGKMSLGLLAADEMLRVIGRNGWRSLDDLGISLKYALEGESVLHNKLFLEAEKLKSLFEVGIAMLFN